MKQYNSPEVMIIELANEDVLTASVLGGNGDCYMLDNFDL